MNSAPVIGIDLGTTFSVAAVYHNNKTESIPDKNNERKIPSCVFYHPNSAAISVGKEAESEGAKYPKNLLFDMKRIIGRKYSDVYVQQFIKEEIYQFKIIAGADNRAEIELEHNNQTIRKTPEEVCSEIIKYLREAATKFLEETVTKAVISVPAYFSMAQEKATQKAAELAGLTVQELITEPVAAAVRYAQERLDHEATLLVFDFGGGTLDLSIIDVNKKKIIVKSVNSETFLGGRDFDKKLLEYAMRDLVKHHGHINTFNQTIEENMLKLKNSCIDLKIELSRKQEACIECFIIYGFMEYEIEMSQTQFEDIAAPLFDKVKETIVKCLNDAEMEKKSISDLILVGGSSRIPKVQEILKAYFKQDLEMAHLDEAVALGAAMQNFAKYNVTVGYSLGFNGDLMQMAAAKKKFQVVFRSDRKGGLVLEQEVEFIRRHIVDEMLRAMRGPDGRPRGPELRVWNSGLVDPGWFLISAQSEETMTWLIEGCPFPQIGMVIFTAMRSMDAPWPEKIYILLEAPEVDLDRLTSVLEVQNRAFRVNEWRYIGIVDAGPGNWLVFFKVDQDIVERLEASGWTLFYELVTLSVNRVGSSVFHQNPPDDLAPPPPKKRAI